LKGIIVQDATITNEQEALNNQTPVEETTLDSNTEQAESNSMSSEDDFDNWQPSKVKDYVKKLRQENKNYRVRSQQVEEKLSSFEKNLKKVLGTSEEDEIDPETYIHELSQANEAQQLQLAIYETALQNGITSPESMEYFQFLFGKRLSELDEDEVLQDEDLEDIVNKAKGFGGIQTHSNSTTFNEDAEKKPESGKTSQISAEDFVKMSVMQKSELYRTNEMLYKRLMKEARDKKLFI